MLSGSGGSGVKLMLPYGQQSLWQKMFVVTCVQLLNCNCCVRITGLQICVISVFVSM